MIDRIPDNAVGPAVFAVAVLAHAVLLQILGPTGVSAYTLDANVYLDLARELWVNGVFRSVADKVYPPVYSLLLSPLFALPSNAARFDAIYLLHALLPAAGALALWPILRELAGGRRAWLIAAALQLLAGITIHGVHPRSETLFTALVMAATAAAWRLGTRQDARSAALLGLVCGVGLATRRTGLALAAAAALLLVLRAVQAWRRDGDGDGDGGRRAALRHEALLAAACLGGLAVGLLPELLVSTLRGEAVRSYADGVVASHLRASWRSLTSAVGAGRAAEVALHHIVYVVVSGFGLPLVWIALLEARSLRERLSPAVRGAVLFSGVVGVALAAMSTLHVLRYWLRPGIERGFQLYPRYVDPMEPVWIGLGVALLCALSAPRAARGLWTSVRIWALATAVAGIGAGPLLSPRGYRVPGLSELRDLGLGESPIGDLAPLAAPIVASLVLLGGAWAIRSNRARTHLALVLVLAVLATWTLSAHRVVRWARGTTGLPPMPLTLQHPRLASLVDRPIAIVAADRENARRYYKMMWRTEHDFHLVPPDRLADWLADHPDGYTLTRPEDFPLDGPVLAESVGWTLLGPPIQLPQPVSTPESSSRSR